MDNLGSGEILVILLVALVVLGPAKLPHAVRQVGHFIGEIRRIGMNFKREFQDALEDPIRQSKATLSAAELLVDDSVDDGRVGGNDDDGAVDDNSVDDDEST